MIRTAMISILMGMLFAPALYGQEVSGSLNDDGFIVLSGNDVELFGVDLNSEQELLVPIAGDDATPFGFLLKNEAKQITYGSLSAPVLLDGDLVLNARYLGQLDNDDLQGEWGGPIEDGPILFSASNPDPVDPDPIDPVDPDPPVVPDPIDPVDPDPPVVPDPIDPVDPTPVDPNPTVPEPAGSSLMVLGLATALLARRRRQR